MSKNRKTRKVIIGPGNCDVNWQSFFTLVRLAFQILDDLNVTLA